MVTTAGWAVAEGLTVKVDVPLDPAKTTSPP